MEAQFKGSSNLNLHRLENHNRAVERTVQNTDEEKKIIETGGRLIQTVDPIYKSPSEKNKIFSRAHFFAPYKYLFGQKVETPLFNILVLWLMTGFLYISLYYDWLRKSIEILAFKKKRGLV